jgi:uncharacterized membrane protein
MREKWSILFVPIARCGGAHGARSSAAKLGLTLLLLGVLIYFEQDTGFRSLLLLAIEKIVSLLLQ